MLKNENIICISSIDWDFIWQGHQEIMSSLARNGNRVLFIENTGVRSPRIRDISRIRSRIRNWLRGVKGIREESENLYVYSPIVLPFPYSRVAGWINRFLILSVIEKWMRVIGFSDPIVWTFLPTPLSVDIADSIMKKLLVYYCIDNFAASSRSAQKIKRSEDNLLKKSDLVFVTSEELKKRCSKHNGRVYKFPFGVCLGEFEAVREIEDKSHKELLDIKRPIIGYVGGVHKWIDKNLIKRLAEKYTDYSFVFVGPVQTDVGMLKKVKNIYFLGQKEHKDVPLFVKGFDVGIIPYLITDYTRNVYPTKLNEYLSLGKPVVSTNLPEVELFMREYGDIVYIAEDEDGFGEYLERALKEGSPGDLKEKRQNAAAENSWENRIRQMSGLIKEEIENKRKGIDLRWKESLVGFYRSARRRVLKIAFYFLLVYFLLFKTPLVWYMAEPLKISQEPQRADVILVFGGGVGETGSPGKSTIERARYAAELYGEGYADKIIFSSGYTYTTNDAENMKLVAFSMGVRSEDILLEQKANSTYENVVYSKEILNGYRWDSIIVVSSPYNMRRAQLVFNRWGPDVEVLYVPVKTPQFYKRSEGVKLEQIKAIMHEYLGIVYYWWKGWI